MAGAHAAWTTNAARETESQNDHQLSDHACSQHTGKLVSHGSNAPTHQLMTAGGGGLTATSQKLALAAASESITLGVAHELIFTCSRNTRISRVAVIASSSTELSKCRWLHLHANLAVTPFMHFEAFSPGLCGSFSACKCLGSSRTDSVGLHTQQHVIHAARHLADDWK